MEKTIKQNVLDSIGMIYDKSAKCKLENSIYSEVEKELNVLSEYFNVTSSQSLIIAAVFSLAYKLSMVDISDMGEHFDCNPMKLLEFSDDFEILQKKGILMKDRMGNMPHFEIKRDQYSINDRIIEAILRNEPMPDSETSGFKDVIDFLGALYDLSEQRDDGNISTFDMFSRVEILIASNLHLPLIKQIADFKFHIKDTFIFIYVIWKTLSGNDSPDLARAVESMFDSPPKKVRYMQEFYSGQNILVRQGYIELEEGGFMNDAGIKLSDNSVELLAEHGLKVLGKNKRRNNIVQPGDIKFKSLHFEKTRMKQLYTLRDLLKKDNFEKMRERLSEKCLPEGINVILHGPPGTGKTETVMQIAKYTGREIMKVEISQSKSMWFGESEKLIKKIFTDYRSYSKDCKATPILLFNEADALFSKRHTAGQSSTSQTENAIQNILLEELESFNGILMATTNLAGNLDRAFERRFLFKIQFEKPGIDIKARIWKSKLPGLSEDACHDLAGRFDFSGGQIENIARKCEIHEIIHGIEVDLNSLIDFCREEIMDKNQAKIGFTIS